MGFSGDRTQHVLWRLDNGEIDGIAPKLAVIMIGTNNSNGEDNTAEEIADGIIAIVEKLNAKLPETQVLVLGIFPRVEKPCPQREKNAKASALVEKYIADATAKGGKKLQYLDIGPKFLTEDGTLPKDIMPDFLHPNTKGYQIWADAIEAKVAEMMGEKSKTGSRGGDRPPRYANQRKTPRSGATLPPNAVSLFVLLPARGVFRFSMKSLFHNEG
jgi:beta-glucosidase